jgi:hypothetical protein
MIKATAKLGDRTLLVIGLSFGNLDKFRAEPGDTFIRIDGKQMQMPVDVLIFSGRTEADMQEKLAGLIGPETVVHIDPRMKS